MQFVLGIMQESYKVGVTNNIAAVLPSLWSEQQSLDGDTGLSLPVNYLPQGQLFATGNISLCGHFLCIEWFISFCMLGAPLTGDMCEKSHYPVPCRDLRKPWRDFPASTALLTLCYNKKQCHKSTLEITWYVSQIKILLFNHLGAM